MKHSVTINLTIEGDIDRALEFIRATVGDYSRISDKRGVEVTGVNFYQEHDFESVTAEGLKREPEVELETEEYTTQPLVEEQENGKEGEKEPNDHTEHSGGQF